MPVHLYGSVADLKSIKKILKNLKEKYILQMIVLRHMELQMQQMIKKNWFNSRYIMFQFISRKNLGAFGDAGIITTNNKNFFQLIRKLRNLGSEKFIHDYVGFNSRLDTIQAAILNIKLKNLNKLNNKRKLLLKIMTGISNKNITKIYYSKNAVYHQYVILVKNRKIIKYLTNIKLDIIFIIHFRLTN